jgi:hypothetical protein
VTGTRGVSQKASIKAYPPEERKTKPKVNKEGGYPGKYIVAAYKGKL